MATPVPSDICEKVDEISLLLVMSSPEDEVGVTMLCEMFDSLATSVQAHSAGGALAEAWHHLKSQRQNLSIGDFFGQLSRFLKRAVQFCEDPESVNFEEAFAEAATPVSAASDDLSGVDTTFLPDFIENHTMQLDELEAWLLDCEFKSDSGEDVNALVKRYLHSLKGDAGAIGLSALEKAVHYVEDCLQTSSAQALAGQLMVFREWIRGYISCLRQGTAPAESADRFIERFKECCAHIVKVQENNSNMPEEQHRSETSEQPSAVIAHEHEAYTLSGERDIFQEFVAEAQEHLGNVESVILEAEGNFSKDAIDTVFRGIHSLKGGSAYFSFKEMTETSHLLENLLDEARDGKRELDQELCALVLEYIDLQKNLLAAAKEALTKDGTIIRSPASAAFLAALDRFVHGGSPVPHQVVTPVAAAAALPPPPEKSSPPQASPPPAEASASAKGEAVEVKTFVKVDTVRLDHLIDSIGEMVIYSSMLIRRCREVLSHDEELLGITHRVEKFARDLQDVGMSMRLVPIKGLFQKMSRLVWDTSKKIKKEIAFSMDGEDTELDRNLIDKLADPLMHMVRNALDHGVEMPDDRERVGKPRCGKVHLSASHSGGSILIRISDDGRGLDPDKLIAKAREKGILNDGQKLSEQEAYQLIFAPGFSTAAAVTDISGRGVGMDVVRKNVESLRGRIHIDSTLGKGTVFTIELPLTLAIVDGVEVTVGTEHFIIPSLAIIEFLKPTAEQLSRTLDRGETFFFRGKFLPVFRLGELFDIEPQYASPVEATLVVVENHRELIALMIDEVVGELSTVIKSLGPVFSEIKGVSGCAVMPNGGVALILDIRSLAQLAREGATPSSHGSEVASHPVH